MFAWEKLFAWLIAVGAITLFVAFLGAFVMRAAPTTGFLKMKYNSLIIGYFWHKYCDNFITMQSLHGSQHFLLHLLWEQRYWHISEHGGQLAAQLTLQLYFLKRKISINFLSKRVKCFLFTRTYLWPQTRVRPHFSSHALWTRPLKQTPQDPVQLCSHAKVERHTSGHFGRNSTTCSSVTVSLSLTASWRTKRKIMRWY